MMNSPAPLNWGELLPGELAKPQADARPVVGIQDPAPVRPELVARGREGDNRRRCSECARLAKGGRCLAVSSGLVIASRTYCPAPDWLRRCEGFAPLPDDPDQRTAAERWPGLTGNSNK